MTTKKAQTVTEIQEEAEQAPEATQKLTAKEQHQNALAEIARLEQEKESKQPFIKDKSFQIALAQQKHKEAQLGYDQAVQTEQESLGRIERQQSMAKIGGEAEQAILQTLQKEHEQIVKNVEFAKSNLDEAELLRDQIPALVEGLDQFLSQLDELEHQKALMISLKDELWQAAGREKADEIRDGIEAARDRRAAAMAAQKEAEDDIRRLRRSIHYELNQWREPRLELLASHGGPVDPLEMSPGERIVTAYIEYVRILIENGPNIIKRFRPDMLAFCERINLSASATQYFMTPGSSRIISGRDAFGQVIVLSVNQQIELAEQLLIEERRNRRSGY